MEQTRFLDRLARGVLPFPAEAQRDVREITVVERADGALPPTRAPGL